MQRVGSESSVSPATSRKYEFRLGLNSDVGKKRGENQDAFGYAQTASESLFIVADGMGGSQGGATASTVAVNIVTKNTFGADKKLTPNSLSKSILAANEAVFNLSNEDKKLSGMGTTIVALGFVKNRAIVAHVGDSRIYSFSNNKLVQLTRDHSLIQDLLDSGTISEEEAQNHPIAHMLTRSLGPTGSVDVDVRVVEEMVQPGDKFLLCSDGLLNHVKDQEISEIISSNDVEKASQKLLDLALERGGSDNITIQLVEAVLPGEKNTLPLPALDKCRCVVSTEMEVEGYLDQSVDADESIEDVDLPTTDDHSEEIEAVEKDQVVESKEENEISVDLDSSAEEPTPKEEDHLKEKDALAETLDIEVIAGPSQEDDAKSLKDPVSEDEDSSEELSSVIEDGYSPSPTVARGSRFAVLFLVVVSTVVGGTLLLSSLGKNISENIEVAMVQPEAALPEILQESFDDVEVVTEEVVAPPKESMELSDAKEVVTLAQPSLVVETAVVDRTSENIITENEKQIPSSSEVVENLNIEEVPPRDVVEIASLKIEKEKEVISFPENVGLIDEPVDVEPIKDTKEQSPEQESIEEDPTPIAGNTYEQLTDSFKKKQVSEDLWPTVSVYDGVDTSKKEKEIKVVKAVTGSSEEEPSRIQPKKEEVPEAVIPKKAQDGAVEPVAEDGAREETDIFNEQGSSFVRTAKRLLNLGIPSLPEKIFGGRNIKGVPKSRVPINWIAEGKNVSYLKEQISGSIKVDAFDEKVSEILKKKHAVRESLYELEQQARILVSSNLGMDDLQRELRSGLYDLRQLMSKLDKSEIQNREKYKKWRSVASSFSERKLIDIADELAAEDDEFAVIYKRYNDALSSYFDADQAWQDDESNGLLAAKVSAANKELREARELLEKQAKTSIKNRISTAHEMLTESAMLKFFAQSASDRQNRAIGLLQGFRAFTKSQRLERAQRLVDEYEQKKSQLDSYRVAVSDEDEIKIRKEQFRKSVIGNQTTP